MKNMIFTAVLLLLFIPRASAVSPCDISSGSPKYPCVCPEGKIADGEIVDAYDCTHVSCPDGKIVEKEIGCIVSPLVIADDKVSINSILNKISFFIIWAVGFLSVAVIMVGGVQYAAALGNEDKTEKAKRTVFYAAVGLAGALLAGTIIKFMIALV